MCNLERFEIDFKGLCADDTTVAYHLDNSYFEALEGAEVSKGDVSVAMNIHRTTDRYFDLAFHISGHITLPCDRCLEDMQLPVDTDARLVVKLGDEYSEDDDLVTVPESESSLNVAWFIYEFIALAIPIKHVHAPGKCNRAMIEMLDEHSATRSSDEDGQQPIDPRWSELLKLKETKD